MLEKEKNIDYQFVIPGRPKAKQSVRYGAGRFYQSRDVKNAASSGKWEIKKIFKESALKDLVAINIIAYFAIPKNTSKANKAALLNTPYPYTPDIDNLEKNINDILKGIVIKDDRQIFNQNTIKLYGNENKTVINISIYRGNSEKC